MQWPLGRDQRPLLQKSARTQSRGPSSYAAVTQTVGVQATISRFAVVSLLS